MDKSILMMSLGDMVRQASPGGSFVRLVKDGKATRWCEVGDITARDKVGHAIRDAIWARRVNRGHAKTMVELFGTPDCQKVMTDEEQTREDLAQTALRKAVVDPAPDRPFHHAMLLGQEFGIDSQIVLDHHAPTILTQLLFNYDGHMMSASGTTESAEDDA
jgi:hypothetical protein